MTTPPRSVPSWDEFFLGLAYIYAGRSKDPSTQCGAVVVDKNNVVLGFGYNGMPRKIDDKKADWTRPQKYPYIKHAEENAIRYSRVTTVDGLEGCTMYVTGPSCSRCMLDIVDKGLARVCYGPHIIACVPREEEALSLTIAERGGVKFERFGGSLDWVKDRFEWMNAAGLFNKDDVTWVV